MTDNIVNWVGAGDWVHWWTC